MYPPLSGSAEIGSIIPPHIAARSPGLLSTWRDHKHFGQWFVYPLPTTVAPQWAQTKSSTVFVNFFIYKITAQVHCDTSWSIRRFHPIHPGPFYADESFAECISGRIRRILPL